MIEEGPGNIHIIELATAYRANLSERENCGHEYKTIKTQPTREPIRDRLELKYNPMHETMEDENRLKGLGADETAEEITTWNEAFRKLRPPPQIKKKKPKNPGMFFNRTCREIADVIKPFRERSQPKRSDKKTIDESLIRLLRESHTSPESEDESELIVQHESNKTPTSPFPLKF